MMKHRQLYRCGDGEIIAEKAVFAVSWFARMRGMIGRRFATSDFDGMVFERCNSVHCCWMSEAIDVLFVSGELEVIRVRGFLKPWRLAFGGKSAVTTIELPAGTVKKYGIVPGDRLGWK
jgi:uncharacterized membrane protein (UPF0127 family)